MLNQVIVSLEEAHGLAAEREGIGRVLYDFVAKSPLELSLHKVEDYVLVKLCVGGIFCLVKCKQLFRTVAFVHRQRCL